MCGVSLRTHPRYRAACGPPSSAFELQMSWRDRRCLASRSLFDDMVWLNWVGELDFLNLCFELVKATGWGISGMRLHLRRPGICRYAKLCIFCLVIVSFSAQSSHSVVSLRTGINRNRQCISFALCWVFLGLSVLVGDALKVGIYLSWLDSCFRALSRILRLSFWDRRDIQVRS